MKKTVFKALKLGSAILNFQFFFLTFQFTALCT